MDYKLKSRIAVVTGGGGAICGEISKALAAEGTHVAIWDLYKRAADSRAEEIIAAGGNALGFECNVTRPESVEAAVRVTVDRFGTIDMLVNGAGGSLKETVTSKEKQFFDLRTVDMVSAFALNYLSMVIPSQAVGRIFAEKKSGVILNITSIAGILPLTRTVSYSDSKAAANSFTRWLAVHMAHNYSKEIRVNAIAPGFILTQLNRFLLIDEATGKMTERGQQILKTVPMARYGLPEEVVGAALWLLSDQSQFVTGAIIPVDGGFSAYSGV